MPALATPPRRPATLRRRGRPTASRTTPRRPPPLLAAAAATLAAAVALAATRGNALPVAAAAAAPDANSPPAPAPSPPPPPPASWDGTAVVIVDHGSRRAASNAQLDEVVEMYKNITGRPVVFPAHMEIAPPSIADAVASCVAAGARKVVIAPYFLSQGRHIAEDVPALAAAAAAANASALPGGVIVSRALGGDEMLARLLEARVVESLEG